MACSARQWLFADVSDADLAGLGVDAQILPIVRLLNSKTDLETVQAMLPDAKYAALQALASRMTVAEAWAEVAQLLPGETPEHVDPDDLVSVMKRTPGHVTFVSGQEELQRILAHPFATWRAFLLPSQLIRAVSGGRQPRDRQDGDHVAPRRLPGRAGRAVAGARQHGYRVYPLVDHIADKFCDIFERHGVTDAPSTRLQGPR